MTAQRALREYHHNQLESHGFITVTYGVTGSDIEPLFREFNDFMDLCDQPDGQQFADALTHTPTDPTAGADYYVNRRRIGDINPHSINAAPATEDKDVAHIGPRSLQLATERLGGKVPIVMNAFLESCIELQQATLRAIRPVYRALELEDVMLAKDERDNQIITRLLRYLGGKASHKAGLHIDRSAFTAASWESEPGLVGTPSNNGIRTPIELAQFEADMERADTSHIDHRSGQMKVFAGAGYDRLPGHLYDRNGPTKMLLHGVLNENPEQERLAVVNFMHPPAGLKGYRIPNRHETGAEEIKQRLMGITPIEAVA